jgi:hypothetical protein
MPKPLCYRVPPNVYVLTIIAAREFGIALQNVPQRKTFGNSVSSIPKETIQKFLFSDIQNAIGKDGCKRRMPYILINLRGTDGYLASKFRKEL